MNIKIRHFKNATKKHGVTIAWKIIDIVKQSNGFPFFVCHVGMAFQNHIDQFSKKTGRELSLERLENNKIEIYLYSDELIDHAICRKIKKMSFEEIIKHKIPTSFALEMKKSKNIVSPFTK